MTITATTQEDVVEVERVGVNIGNVSEENKLSFTLDVDKIIDDTCQCPKEGQSGFNEVDKRKN